MRSTTAMAILCVVMLLAVPVGANVNIFGFAALNPDGYHSLYAGIGGVVPHRLGLYSNAAWLDDSSFSTQSEIVAGYTLGLGTLRIGGGLRFVSEDIKDVVDLPNGHKGIELRESHSWVSPYVTGEVVITSGPMNSSVIVDVARASDQFGWGWSVNVGYQVLGDCSVSAAYISPPHVGWRSGVWYGISCQI